MIVTVEYEVLTGQSSATDEFRGVFHTDVQDGLFVLSFYGGEDKRYFPVSRVIQIIERTSD